MARFQAAHTQVLGVSIDSVFSHANWGSSLGGVSFPLLADFHPKGKMAADYGAYLDGAGISDRATVLIDSNGVVQHASSVTPAGQRDIGELLALCEALDAKSATPVEDISNPKGLPGGSVLYIKSQCGFSRKANLVASNLHASLTVKNVSDDAGAMAELKTATSKEQAPCLISGGETLQESDDIVARVVELCATPL